MAFQVSPGVQVKELDLTTIVPTIATTPAGFVGLFSWGPANEVATVSSENELRELYGEPNDANAAHWWTAASFLRYGSNLQVVRAEPDTSLNAGHGVSGGVSGCFPLTDKLASAGGALASTDYSSGTFVARYPGKLGNSIGVAVWDSAATGTGGADAGTFANWGPVGNTGLWAAYFRGEPDTSQKAQNATGITTGFNDELHVVIYDADGKLTGTKNTPLEIYEAVSKATDAKLPDGSTNYYRNRINNLSEYVVVTKAVEQTTPRGLNETIGEVFGGDAGASFGAFFSPDGVTDSNNFTLGLSFEFAGDGGTGYTAGSIGTTVQGQSGATLGTGTILSVEDVTFAEGVTSQNILVDVSSGTFLVGGTFDGSGLSGDFTSVAQKLIIDTAGDALRNGVEFAGGVASGGEDGVTSEITTQYTAIFDNAEERDVSFLVSGPADKELQIDLVGIAERRKDCIVTLSPQSDSVVEKSSGQATSILEDAEDITIKSSFAVMDSGWKLVYDPYNDVYRYVPLNGDIAGLMVASDQDSEPWFSPAGFNRGRLRNVIKLAYSPNKADRDALYVKGVNPVVAFESEGVVLFGDKTMLAKPSAFDRINVRRLFNVLEKSIATAAKFSLFEFNDEFTRASFRNLVEPFLRDVQARRGIFDFKVVCDESNNTPVVIDRNEFVADIYIKPARSINFITLSFIATPTGVDFEEIGA